jgi:hypothetical protein
MPSKQIVFLLFGLLLTTGSTSQQASFENQSSICTFQGRLLTHREGASQERLALVLNQRTQLETTIELMGTGLKDVSENRGLRAEVEVEIREDILGSVTWAKFRKLNRVLDSFEETQEYVTQKSIREVCHSKKASNL